MTKKQELEQKRKKCIEKKQNIKNKKGITKKSILYLIGFIPFIEIISINIYIGLILASMYATLIPTLYKRQMQNDIKRIDAEIKDITYKINFIDTYEKKDNLSKKINYQTTFTPQNNINKVKTLTRTIN